jgi:uncharacterized protein (TIGR02001 family)
MKKIITTTLAVGLMAGFASAEEAAEATAEVPATEVSVSVDFASAYVFRGVTLNDGFVIQPGLEATGFGLAEHCGSLTLGTWGNFDVDDYNGGESSEFSEVDWYVSYSLPTLVDGLDLFVGWTEYTYPSSAGGNADKEANVGAGFDLAGVALGATAYFGAGGAVHSSQYYLFDAGYDLELAEDLGASLGASFAYADIDGGENGFADGTLSAALGYALSDNWSVGASLTYIAQLDDDVLTDEDIKATGAVGYDVDFVGMLSIAGSF